MTIIDRGNRDIIGRIAKARVADAMSSVDFKKAVNKILTERLVAEGLIDEPVPERISGSGGKRYRLEGRRPKRETAAVGGGEKRSLPESAGALESEVDG